MHHVCWRCALPHSFSLSLCVCVCLALIYVYRFAKYICFIKHQATRKGWGDEDVCESNGFSFGGNSSAISQSNHKFTVFLAETILALLFINQLNYSARRRGRVAAFFCAFSTFKIHQIDTNTIRILSQLQFFSISRPFSPPPRIDRVILSHFLLLVE